MPETNGQLAKSKYWLGVAMWVVGVGTTMLAGFASVTWTRGADSQRLIVAEQKIEKLEKQIDASRDRYVSHEELIRYLNAQTSALEQIQEDVRDMRRTQR